MTSSSIPLSSPGPTSSACTQSLSTRLGGLAGDLRHLQGQCRVATVQDPPAGVEQRYWVLLLDCLLQATGTRVMSVATCLAVSVAIYRCLYAPAAAAAAAQSVFVCDPFLSEFQKYRPHALRLHSPVLPTSATDHHNEFHPTQSMNFTPPSQ